MRRATGPRVPTTVVAATVTAVSLVLAVAGCRGSSRAGSSHHPTDAGGPANPWLGRRVLSIAHGGGEDEAPHSTLFAYKRAAAAGASVLDLDTQLSSDGVLVVQHNDTVDANTNGHGPVDRLSYAQLHALDAAYWFTRTCWACTGRPAADYLYRGIRTGQKPPPAGYRPSDFAVTSVDSVLRAFPHQSFDIELKGTYPSGVPAARALARLLHRDGAARRTVVASFDDKLLAAFKRFAPDVWTSAGQQAIIAFYLHRTAPAGQVVLDVPAVYQFGGQQVDVVTKRFVDDAHCAGLAVWVWMNGGVRENAAFYTRMIDTGVDGLNASRPALLQRVLRARHVTWDGSYRRPAYRCPAQPSSSSSSSSTPTVTAGPGPG